MKKLLGLLCAVVVAIGVSNAAEASSIVYSQAPFYVPNGSVGSGWTTSHSNIQGGFRTFDDFTLGTGADITGASWLAFVWNSTVPAANPAAPTTTTWDVRFYADAAGTPGGTLHTDVFPAASVTTTLLGTSVFGTDTVNVYRFDATLGTAFHANAGTKYWFSPLSEQPLFDPLVSWIAATTNGPAFQEGLDPAGNVTSTFARTDRAFQLVGNPVPEPASLLLLATGLAGSAIRARRKARRG